MRETSFYRFWDLILLDTNEKDIRVTLVEQSIYPSVSSS